MLSHAWLENKSLAFEPTHTVKSSPHEAMATQTIINFAGTSGSSSMILMVALLLLGSLYLSWDKLRGFIDNGDILLSILKHTAPVAASDELKSSQTLTCLRKMNGTALVITKGSCSHYYNMIVSMLTHDRELTFYFHIYRPQSSQLCLQRQIQWQLCTTSG